MGTDWRDFISSSSSSSSFLGLKMPFVLSRSCHSLFRWILFPTGTRELWGLPVMVCSGCQPMNGGVDKTKCNVDICVLRVDRQMPWMDPAF